MSSKLTVLVIPLVIITLVAKSILDRIMAIGLASLFVLLAPRPVSNTSSTSRTSRKSGQDVQSPGSASTAPTSIVESSSPSKAVSQWTAPSRPLLSPRQPSSLATSSTSPPAHPTLPFESKSTSASTQLTSSPSSSLPSTGQVAPPPPTSLPAQTTPISTTALVTPTTASPPASPLPGFLQIPPEVVLRIVAKLDLQDAKSLGLTCRQLQPLAETKVWSEVTFELHHQPQARAKNLRDGHSRQEGDTKEAKEKQDRGIKVVKWNAHRHKKVYERFLLALGKGEERERKLAMIDKAEVVVYGAIRSKIAELVRLLGPHLKELTLRANPFNTSRLVPPPLVVNPTPSLDLLTNLSICNVEIDLQGTLIPILSSSPNLTALTLDCPTQRWWYRENDTLSDLPVPDMSRLRELHLNFLDDRWTWPAFVKSLLESAKEVETLTLKRHGNTSPMTAPVKGLIKALSKRPHITRLDWGYLGYDTLTADKGFNQVQSLTFQAHSRGLESDTDSVKLEWFRVEPFSAVRTIELAHNYTPHAPPVCTSFRSTPIYTSPLLPRVRRTLEECPDLLSITQTARPEAQGVIPARTLIRQYQGINNTFTHIRTYSRHRYFWCRVPDASLQLGLPPAAYAAQFLRDLWRKHSIQPISRISNIGVSHRLTHTAAGHTLIELKITVGEARWEEMCEFNGEHIPKAVLEQVYLAIGEDYEWTTPGRKMEMKTEGWAVLRQWKETGKVDRLPGSFWH